MFYYDIFSASETLNHRNLCKFGWQ